MTFICKGQIYIHIFKLKKIVYIVPLLCNQCKFRKLGVQAQIRTYDPVLERRKDTPLGYHVFGSIYSTNLTTRKYIDNTRLVFHTQQNEIKIKYFILLCVFLLRCKPEINSENKPTKTKERN